MEKLSKPSKRSLAQFSKVNHIVEDNNFEKKK